MFATDVVVAKLRPFLKNQSYFQRELGKGHGPLISIIRLQAELASSLNHQSLRLAKAPGCDVGDDGRIDMVRVVVARWGG